MSAAKACQANAFSGEAAPVRRRHDQATMQPRAATVMPDSANCGWPDPRCWAGARRASAARGCGRRDCRCSCRLSASLVKRGRVSCDRHRADAGPVARVLAGEDGVDRRVGAFQRRGKPCHFGGDVVDAFAQQGVLHPLGRPAFLGLALHGGEFAGEPVALVLGVREFGLQAAPFPLERAVAELARPSSSAMAARRSASVLRAASISRAPCA